MSHWSLSKIFHSSKGKKKKGHNDERAAAHTSPATAADIVGDISEHSTTEPYTSVRQKIGLFELSKAEVLKTVDVVAVHGLQGDAYGTWEHECGTLWLRDLLPDDAPSARIMTFGYDSTIAFSKSVGCIDDTARDLLNRLGAQRDESTNRRPIVFICHSLGGIVVKKALILAHERSPDLEFEDILTNTKAIAFLAVPHRGSDSAWWAAHAASLLNAATAGRTTNKALVSDLRKGSSALMTISQQFVQRSSELKIYAFYETLKYKGSLIVDMESALLNLPRERLFPVAADHRTICKLSSREDQVYGVVGVRIKKLIEGCIKTTKELEEIKDPERLENDPFLEIRISTSLVDLMKAQSELLLETTNISLPVPVLESPEFVKWTSGVTKEFLWHRGKPGCGKSVMVSQVLKRLFEDLDFTGAVTFFDFAVARKMDRMSANISAAFISFIAAQLIERKPTLWSVMSSDSQRTMIRALKCTHKIFSYKPASKSDYRRVMMSLVSDLRIIQESTLWSSLCHMIDQGFGMMSQIYVVVDGDDIAFPEERIRFLRNLRAFWERSESTHRGCLKILIASRNDPKARQVLDGLPYSENDKEQQGAENARKDLIADGEKNTGQWILSDPQYLGWRDEPGSALLWLQGNPGTGKSTLMKQIQNRLVNGDTLSKTVVASFYYSAREGEPETSHKTMLQAVLHQILLQKTEETYPFFRPIFREKRGKMQPWRFEELRSIFVSISRSHSESLEFFLLLDALDESDNDRLSEIITLLKDGITSEAKLKILVASRPGPIIGSELAKSRYHLILENRNEKDIEKMIATSIGFLQESDTATFEWISKYILSRAKGVFLWVSLIVSNIERLSLEGWSIFELKSNVQALPDSLLPYYKRITSRLACQEDAIVKEGIRMLLWIVYSERPLTVVEFRDAAATSCLSTVNPFMGSNSNLHDYRLKGLKERLMRNCGELVEVKHPVQRAVESSNVDPGDVVQLFHETVREFLKDPKGPAAPFYMKTMLGHAEIAVVCARYIRMALILSWRRKEESHSLRATETSSSWNYETHRRFAQHLSDRPLLPYALKFLPRHMNFLEDPGQARTTCIECFNDFDSYHGLLFLSSWLQISFGLPSCKVTVDADEAAKFRVCSLVAAADQGLATAVKCLMELQTASDTVEETINHSALQIASKNGHTDVVNILIDYGADTNFQGGHFGTALQAAAYCGRESIVKGLLASGADPNSDCGYLCTPFCAAVCMGQYHIANRLLRAGADCSAPESLFRKIRNSGQLRALFKNVRYYLDLENDNPDLPLAIDGLRRQFLNAEAAASFAIRERGSGLGRRVYKKFYGIETVTVVPRI